MKNLEILKFKNFTTTYENWLLIIKKNWHVITKARIDNDKDLIKNINYLLILDYTYEKKFNLMEGIYRKSWYSEYWLYEKAWDDARKTKEWEEIEKEKQKLLASL